MPYRILTAATVALLVFATTGCSDDDVEDPDTGVEDVDDSEDVDEPEDAQEDVEEDVDDGISDEHVPIDLGSYIADAPDPGGSATVFVADEGDELPEGAAATSRTGDYVIENDHVRFVVEQADRNISMCPWGGNIIDAEYLDGDYGGDILGEICLFLNAEQTMVPHTFEIIDDGSDSAAVLAVTGESDILDFLNVVSLAAWVSPQIADLIELTPDELLPMTITKYYVLRPGDRGVRVLTAMRNDGDEQLNIVPKHLMVGAADGSWYNPLSEMGGFGYIDRGMTDPNPDRLPFMALTNHESTVAYMPQPDDNIEDDLPVAGAYLTMFNVVASVLGQTDIVGTFTASDDQLAERDGVVHLDPEQIEVLDYWAFVGDGDLSTTVDVIYPKLGVDTGDASGAVVDDDGEPVAGVLVSGIDGEERTMNQAITDGDGTYDMALPPGDYEFVARGDTALTTAPVTETITAGDDATVDDLVVERMGTIDVSVETPAGDATPARVSLLCDDVCPDKMTSNIKDVTFDGLPDEYAAVGWVGVDGELEMHVPEGSYTAVVSRGLEWSVWPENAFDTGGEPVEVTSGESVELNAEIAQVVDTTGVLSGDFHVHTMASLDSTTPKQDRVLSFLTEGVDVIASTDHDNIVDYAPAIEAVGATGEIVSMIGTEVTTIDLGHFNGFPLMLDEHHRRGGSFDWAAGSDDAHTPQAIFDWMRESPGEQVVQIDHPDSSFLRFSDVLRGISYGDPDVLRVQMPDYDPDTGRSGLWSDDFTAFELMNGHNMDRFWGVTRWWLTLIGRGHDATGTAVTDTHTRYGRVFGGVPRTYVTVDEGSDTAADFDTDHFVSAVNDQRAFGTNGPFVRVEATNDDGDTAGLGEVVETVSEPVNFEISIEVPEWIDVDEIEMVINSEDVVTGPGEYDTDPVEPTETHPVDWSDVDPEVVADGEFEHRRMRTTVDIEVDVDEDAYVVFFIRGSESMYPVLGDDSVTPFAFTNPVYLDSDGDGYSDPPLAELAETDPPDSPPNMLRHSADDPFGGMTREEILERLHEHADHHDHHGHHHHH